MEPPDNNSTGNMWQQIKDIVDWFWLMLLGIAGNVGAHWDSYIAKLTAFMAFILLVDKIKRRFFSSKKQAKDNYDV